MSAKIISFPAGHFVKRKHPALTTSMIKTLKYACAMQRNKIDFGPIDVKGSLGVLISRGLIVRKHETMRHTSRASWKVTDEAIQLLKTLGISIRCKGSVK